MQPSQKTRLDALFSRASRLSDNGRYKSAFRLFLAGAQKGDLSCRLNVGTCYDAGTGVRPDRAAALYWYKRAYRRGDASAASNIGTIWRDEDKLQRALYWFQRAVALGDDDANLEIARIYLCKEDDRRKAIPYLQRVCRSQMVTESSKEEAQRLLKEVRGRWYFPFVVPERPATLLLARRSP